MRWMRNRASGLRGRITGKSSSGSQSSSRRFAMPTRAMSCTPASSIARFAACTCGCPPSTMSSCGRYANRFVGFDPSTTPVRGDVRDVGHRGPRRGARRREHLVQVSQCPVGSVCLVRSSCVGLVPVAVLPRPSSRRPSRRDDFVPCRCEMSLALHPQRGLAHGRGRPGCRRGPPTASCSRAPLRLVEHEGLRRVLLRGACQPARSPLARGAELRPRPPRRRG